MFDVNNEDWVFDRENGYTRKATSEEYEDAWFRVEHPSYIMSVWVDGKYEPYPPLKEKYSPPP